jgi:hypothetical protein
LWRAESKKTGTACVQHAGRNVDVLNEWGYAFEKPTALSTETVLLVQEKKSWEYYHYHRHPKHEEPSSS